MQVLTNNVLMYMQKQLPIHTSGREK